MHLLSGFRYSESLLAIYHGGRLLTIVWRHSRSFSSKFDQLAYFNTLSPSGTNLTIDFKLTSLRTRTLNIAHKWMIMYTCRIEVPVFDYSPVLCLAQLGQRYAA